MTGMDLLHILDYHAHLVLYDSDPGDTMIVVTLGLSFENLALQHYLTVRSCILGCRYCLDFSVSLCYLVGYCLITKY